MSKAKEEVHLRNSFMFGVKVMWTTRVFLLRDSQ